MSYFASSSSYWNTFLVSAFTISLFKAELVSVQIIQNDLPFRVLNHNFRSMLWNLEQPEKSINVYLTFLHFEITANSW